MAKLEDDFETPKPLPGFGKGKDNTSPIRITNPSPARTDGSHISKPIRAQLGKLTPELGAGIRRVADTAKPPKK